MIYMTPVEEFNRKFDEIINDLAAILEKTECAEKVLGKVPNVRQLVLQKSPELRKRTLVCLI